MLLPNSATGRTLAASRKDRGLSARDEPAAPDTVYCLLHRHRHPDRFPVQVRPEMTFVRARVVAERDGARLLCGTVHDGAHRWPDGEAVEDGR
jgi:hypothetical protein